MSRIKVLHIITRLIVGGAQENTVEIAALLDSVKFDVEIVSGPQTGSEGSLIEEVRSMGLHLTILPSLIREIQPLQDFKTLISLIKMLRANSYTIVHTHSSKAGILGRLAARIAGVPVIVHTVHGWGFHNFISPMLRSVYILLERYAATFTDAIIAVSEADIQKGVKNHIGRESQYHLIRSAIKMDQFDPNIPNRVQLREELGIPQNAIMVGSISRFSKQKNPLDWVRTAGIIQITNPEVLFLLVGDGPLRERVVEQIDNLGLTERIILTGIRRDLPQLMSVIDIFMLSSLWEGLPRTVIQAMAMELPVLAFAVDGVNEVVKNDVNGYTCPPGEIESLARQCVSLISNSQKRRSMGEKGRKIVESEFDLPAMISQLSSLYISLIEK